ncbi:MAG TPA: AI-2E family transporter [Ignavibacteriaceae bacterium]|nr:AI-2E family transporter [Ignavibacteriaceae bacterium]
MPYDQITAKHTKLAAYFLGFLTLVLCVYILMALKDILIPVTIAVFLTFLFHPLLLFLQRYSIPKWATLVLILMLVGGFYYLIVLLFISSYDTFTKNMQIYSNNLISSLNQILLPFNITLKQFAAFLNIDAKLNFGSIMQKLFKAGLIQDVLSSATGILGDFFISLIFWLFMMSGKTKFEERLKFAFSSRREAVEENIEMINTQLQSYIIIKTILSFIAGVIVTTILFIYGIDFALIWGLLTFILNFIPNIGSFISTIAPILISFLEYGFGFRTISLAVLLLVVHNIIGNLIEPHYLGRRMDLSPVFVLFSLIFWGWIWGIVGMFLAVPIAAFMKILFGSIEPLKPVAVLMGSRYEENINEYPGNL